MWRLDGQNRNEPATLSSVPAIIHFHEEGVGHGRRLCTSTAPYVQYQVPGTVHWNFSHGTTLVPSDTEQDSALESPVRPVCPSPKKLASPTKVDRGVIAVAGPNHSYWILSRPLRGTEIPDLSDF